MIKLIVTDIDGTLVPDCEHVLNPRYFELITELREKGIFFGVTTGRQVKGIRRMFDPVKDQMILIAQNGAYVICDGKELFFTTMSKEDSEELVRDTRELPGCASMYDTRNVSYYEPGMEEVYHLMKDGALYDCEIVPDLTKVEAPCVKYTVFHSENVERVTMGEFVPKWKERLQVFAAGSRFMDLAPKGVNKGVSLEMVQRYLSVKPEETVAIGDNINDLNVFAYAGYRFAVANARDEVKEACEYITDDCAHEGVLKVMEEVLEKAGQNNLFESYKK